MSDYRNYRDYGRDACGSVVAQNPDLDTPTFRRFVVERNRADCDDGELENIAEPEILRLAARYRTW